MCGCGCQHVYVCACMCAASLTPPGVLTRGKRRCLPAALSGQVLGSVLRALQGDGCQVTYPSCDSFGVHTSVIPCPGEPAGVQTSSGAHRPFLITEGLIWAV